MLAGALTRAKNKRQTILHGGVLERVSLGVQVAPR
jgi:hypothetical protein